MKIHLDHDWQGNMASPRKILGEKTKLHFFFFLSFIWIFTGLVGHEPWRPHESASISQILEIFQHNQFIHPSNASNTIPFYPPLYAFFGAAFAKLFSPFLEIHDGARIANAMWVSITMISLGLLTRELYGTGFGRTAGLLFIASVGLILNIHTLSPEVAALAGFALSLYSFSLYFRRPFRASVILGVGLSIVFLSIGIVPTLSIVLTSFLLGCFTFWMNKRYFIFLSISYLIFSCIIGLWLFLFYQSDADLFLVWISQPHFNSDPNFWYNLQGLSWFTWPAFPLAIWIACRNYKSLLTQKRTLLPIIFILTYFLIISFSIREDQINWMPFILPFCLLAVGSIDLLKRSYAGALNWFGILVFGFISFLIWLGWFAMQTGFPAKIYERMFFLSAEAIADFRIIHFLAALFLTAFWLINAANNKITNRSSITNWAIGITMIWTTLIMLWGPFIDNRKSHKTIYLELKPILSQSSSCLYTHNISTSQIDLVHYYTRVKPTNPANQEKICRLALISLSNGNEIPAEYKNWKEIWTGKRTMDKFYYILLSK